MERCNFCGHERGSCGCEYYDDDDDDFYEDDFGDSYDYEYEEIEDELAPW